ncbi:MAG: gamma carbonic anhydrase family protein [Proteobacteria bacterium]|nr:gamma carbonic anhydrase family protein [Pseudomonadota bacterium]
MSNQANDRILKPRIHPSVFIAEGARIYGDVEIGEGASVWFNAVIRGDEGPIVIGKNTNIQDNAVVHSDRTIPVEIADNVTVGHSAVIRGCKIARNVMVGMNATIMSGANIGEYCVIGANSFVSYNKEFPPRSLITGIPAKLVRELTDEETAVNDVTPELYAEVIEKYRRGLIVSHETS